MIQFIHTHIKSHEYVNDYTDICNCIKLKVILH